METIQNNPLFDALSKAQEKFKHAKKSISNTFYKNKYADLASVIDVYRNILPEFGFSISHRLKYIDGQVLMVTSLYHVSGQSLDSEYPILPVKNDPQSYGSAISYARRYCVCALLGIASEDDDDDGNLATEGDTAKDIMTVLGEINKANTLDELKEIWQKMYKQFPLLREQIKNAKDKRKNYIMGLENATAQ